MLYSEKQLDAVGLAELYEDIAEGRLQALRRNFGLTQSDIARTIGVSRSAVASWEDGRRRPRGVSAARYKFLCTSLLELSSRVSNDSDLHCAGEQRAISSVRVVSDFS